MDFVGADPSIHTCFYVNNTTDGLNKLASALVESEDDLVLCTRIEHHANDLSWRERCNVIYAEVDEQGRVIYDDIERLLPPLCHSFVIKNKRKNNRSIYLYIWTKQIIESR